MVAKSATRLICVSAIKSVPAENCWRIENFGVENAGIEFAKGVLIASGMSVVLWGGLIGALARIIPR